MNSPACLFKRFLFVLLVILLIGLPNSMKAQKVPVSFDEFHGFSGTEQYLKKVAKAYPDITELRTIGESTMGRPLYVLIVTNRQTGVTIDRFVPLQNERKENVENVLPMPNHLGKSGQWICASTHGNEYTGTEVCLYIIDKLITAYGSDESITDLIDNQSFYICPMVNPDGVYSSVEKGIPQRQNSMLKDNDEDGKVNEDGPEDINKDGVITWFRYKDEKGRYVLDDEDPRVMVRIGRSEKTKKERWSMILEGIDNDKDGKTNEDGEAGFDLNRNFPEGWFTADGYQGGTGDYPTSAPETRALAEFFTNHKNIHQAQFFHTSGGFTYRPMGSSGDDSMHPADIAVYDYILGKKFLEILDIEVPKAWQYPDSLATYKKELAKESKNKYALKRGYEMPRTWKVSYNEQQNKGYGYGLQADWAYMQQGVFSVTTELFNYRTDLPGHKFEGKDAYRDYQRAALKYQEDNFDGKLFKEWENFKHPTLGDGEIGGWLPQYGSNNPFPGEPLLDICEKHWQFEIFRAGLMPRVEVVSATGKVLEKVGKYQIVEVTAKVKNSGELATHLGNGAKISMNRQDVIWLIGPRDRLTFLQGAAWQKVGVLGGNAKIPTQSKGKNSAEVKWIVKIRGNTPIKVVLTSQKGGTVV